MKKEEIYWLILLIASIGVAAGMFLAAQPPSEAPIVFFPAKRAETKGAIAAVGWSVAETEEQAVDEAVSGMAKKMKKAPDFVFVYTSSVYDEEKLLPEIKKRLPETKIFGGTTFLGVMTPGGYLAGQPQSLAILGVATPRITWGANAQPVTDKISVENAAKLATLAAIRDADKIETEKPDYIIIVPTIGGETAALRGIAEAVGKDVPVFGTHAVDNAIKGEWRVFGNDKIYQNGVAVAVVYTDLKVSGYLENGFEVTEAGGKVTKAEKNKIIEIDGRPAGEVYNEWIGGALESEVKNPDKAQLIDLILKSTPNPLAKAIKVQGREPYYAATPVIGILPDRSLIVELEFQKGDELKVLRGDWEVLLNRLRTVPEKAMNDFGIKKENIIFALDSFCGATKLIVPEEERPKMPKLFEEAIGDAPFAGVFSCGIQTNVPRIGNVQTSLGFGTLIFSF